MVSSGRLDGVCPGARQVIYKMDFRRNQAQPDSRHLSALPSWLHLEPILRTSLFSAADAAMDGV